MYKQTKIAGVVGLAVTVMAFYGGMKYGQVGSSNLQSAGVNFQNSQRQQFGAARGARGGNGGGVTAGEILSKDDKSITVKLRDGGSKIVFLSGATEVSAFTAATPDALEVGKTVMVSGKQNSDGTVTAQTIQVRPPFTAQPTMQGAQDKSATDTPAAQNQVVPQ